MAAARGIAGFFGLFSLLNSLGVALGSNGAGDSWWIDTAPLQVWLAALLTLGVAVVLLLWAFLPSAGRLLARAAAIGATVLALFALSNSITFYRAVAAGGVSPAVPVPFSLFVALGLAWVAWCAARRPQPAGRRQALGAAATAVALVVLFPLAQIAFFGTTDYRRPADAVVVFGAKAYANGMLSTSLEDRVRTGADLYRAGLVRVLVMSGGVGESGIDETIAMRDRAIAMGVPRAAIVRDPGGASTEATARGTAPILAELGAGRVLAVSQFYHLPRIKMAYGTVGIDVQTVPATTSRYIPETPALVLREVGGFWAYWARGLFCVLEAP